MAACWQVCRTSEGSQSTRGLLLVQAAAQQTAAILEVARTEAENLQACLQHEQVRFNLE